MERVNQSQMNFVFYFNKGGIPHGNITHFLILYMKSVMLMVSFPNVRIINDLVYKPVDSQYANCRLKYPKPSFDNLNTQDTKPSGLS